jgi:hypothetical protein
VKMSHLLHAIEFAFFIWPRLIVGCKNKDVTWDVTKCMYTT